MNHSTHHRHLFVVLAFTMSAVGCGDFEKEILIPRQTIQTRVEQHFPFEQNAMLAKLVLRSPRIYFSGKSIGVKLDYEAFILTKTLKGNVDFTGELVYKPEAGAFYLTNIRMAALSANDAALAKNKTLKQFAENFVTQKLAEQPVYVLKETDTKQKLARLLLKDIRVRGDNLAVVLSLNKSN